MKVTERAVMGDPGAAGRFGPFGGRFVPEALVPACEELEREFRAAWADDGFRAELEGLLERVIGERDREGNGSGRRSGSRRRTGEGPQVAMDPSEARRADLDVVR